MSAHVIARVDAGPGIGLGHLQRCLALAAAFSEAGCSATFLVNDDPLARDRVTAARWPVRQLTGVISWTDADADAVIAEAKSGREAIVLVDSDEEPPTYIRRLRSAGLFVCAVEDLLVADLAADVLLNGDAHGELIPYGASHDTTLLLGPSFAPLPPPYWASNAPPACVPPVRVLVTLGGADPHNLMPALLREAVNLPAWTGLTVAVGPFSRNRAAVGAAVEPLGNRAVVHHAPEGMFPLIAECDLALTGAGQTLYELAALGRPAVAIQIAANQAPQLAEFERQGAAIGAGAATDPGIAARAVAMLGALAADPSHLRKMAAAGRRFIDGQGARRAASAVLARAATAPRPASAGDPPFIRI